MVAKNEDFASLFQESIKKKLTKNGDVVKGRVISIQGTMAVIDFGYKLEGLIPLSEFRAPVGEVGVKVGDKVEVILEQLETRDGYAVLSKERVDALQIWDRLQAALDSEEPVDGIVIEKVKGGLSVDIGVRAFLPASQ